MLLYTLFRETHLYTVIFASSFCFHAALISFKEEKQLRSSCFATSNKCDYNAFTTESSPNLHLFFLYSYSTFFTKTMSPCQHFYLFSLRIWKFLLGSAFGFFFSFSQRYRLRFPASLFFVSTQLMPGTYIGVEGKCKPPMDELCSCVTGSSVSPMVPSCRLALHGIVASVNVIRHY